MATQKWFVEKDKPVERRLVSDQVFSVPENSSGVNTGVDVQPGDRIVLVGGGKIWAGVWLTGENGPAGWTNIDNDPKFPLRGWHPFGLIGQLTNYFAIGDGVDFVYGGPRQERLFLRTNDDNPGNGSGAFTCQVQRWVTVSQIGQGKAP